MESGKKQGPFSKTSLALKCAWENCAMAFPTDPDIQGQTHFVSNCRGVFPNFIAENLTRFCEKTQKTPKLGSLICFQQI